MSTTPWAPTSLYDYRGGDRISDLIMRRGQIQAERSARSGEIWGGAIQNAGQQLGSALQQRSQTQALAKRDAAFVNFLGSWDGQDKKVLLTETSRLFGPEGPKIAQGVLAFQGLSEEGDDKDVARLLTTAEVLDKFPDEFLAKLWPDMRPKAAPTLAKRFGVRPEQLSEEWNPEARQVLHALAEAKRGVKPEEEYTLTPGAKRFRGDKVLADNPAAPPQSSFQAKEVLDDTGKPVMANFDARTGRYVNSTTGQPIQSPRPVPSAHGSATGLSPTMESNIVNRLTTQWDKAVAPVQDLSRQARLMQTGLAAAERGDMAAGSQAVLVTFQKILDPTSVVRESEYARSASGQALLARIQGSFEKLAQGGAGVPLSELKKFAKLAEEMVESSMGDYVGAVKERIGKTADRYKVPRDLIFEDFSFGKTKRDKAGEITATGPNGQKLVLRNGQWVPL